MRSGHIDTSIIYDTHVQVKRKSWRHTDRQNSEVARITAESKTKKLGGAGTDGNLKSQVQNC